MYHFYCLFIQIKNNTPFEHPIMENNFTQVFPDVDIDNLPEEFAEFIRIPQPIISVFEVCEGCTYERDGDIFKDGNTWKFKWKGSECGFLTKNAAELGLRKVSGKAKTKS